MNNINDGGPAFPTDHSDDISFTDIKGGMSLRDWFAGMALQGLCANTSMMNSIATVSGADPILNDRILARFAIEKADAMLALMKK